MKKVLLIVGTVVVLGLAALGLWIYGIVQNGVSQYTIAGETVRLAGFASEVVAGEPNTATATFTERLMPFTVGNFPFDAACAVIAPDFARADILTIIASGDAAEAARVYDIIDGSCVEQGG